MTEVTGAIFLLFMIGGLYYFWYKCQMFLVSKIALISGLLLWPAGMVIGIYWAIKDIFLFGDFGKKEDLKNNQKIIDGGGGNGLQSDVNYSRALEEYQNKNLDKDVAATFLGENDVNGGAAKKYEANNDLRSEKYLSLDDAYLQALDEYESKNLDRALFARLLAENDGKEDIVKARYIKLRAEKLTKNGN